MKKVCFFITSLNSGGIENYLLRFLKHYNGKIDCVVICKSGIFGELESEYRLLDNVQLLRIKLGFINILKYFQLWKLFKDYQFTTVCDFTGNFAGLILFVAKIAQINNRIAFYRGSTNHFKDNIINRLYNYLMNFLVRKFATSIFSNSESAFNFFFKSRDNRFRKINNGVSFLGPDFKLSNSEIRENLSIPLNSFVVGHTGRVHYSKNHKTILQVANILCARYHDLHFVLAGKNTDIELLNDFDENIKDQVHLLGYRSDIPDLLQCFDIYFFPSITEGQPNSLIEAMLSGLPIIASNIDPIKEVVPIEIHDTLLLPYDIYRFVDSIEDYYLNREKRNNFDLSEWARVNYNPEVQFELFYKEIFV